MLRLSQATSTQFDVAAYRDLVDTVAAELAAAEPIDDDVVLDVVGSAIVSPAARGLIAAADVDPLQLTARAAAVARRFAPRQAATARTAGDEIVILLRQQIDLAWWNGVADFDTSADVAGDASLVDMRALRRAGKVRFGFTLASDRLLPRARNYAVRHWFRDIAPGTPGPSWPYARPQMVNLLNRLADDFAEQVGPELPPMWVNCLTRSVEDQQRLQELGFSAHLPSAHCRGWAADIEVSWFDRFGVAGDLVEVLEHYRDRGLINAIDEGSIWHICPNPAHLHEWDV